MSPFDDAFLGNAVQSPTTRREQGMSGIGAAASATKKVLVYKTSVERWRRYEPWLGELRELLPAAKPGAV
jgi:hypothetical protein